MKNIIKTIAMLISGAIIFEIICSGTEYIVLTHLQVKANLCKLLLENFFSSLIIYIVICCCLFAISRMYNYLIVKKLNNKLKVLKKKGGE